MIGHRPIDDIPSRPSPMEGGALDDAVRVGQAASLSRAASGAGPRYFDVAPAPACSRIATGSATPWQHPTLIALHGLESSSDAHYVRGLADKAFAAGFNAVRLNQRNCGGTEHLSDGLYHSGPYGRSARSDARADRCRWAEGVCDRRLLARRQPGAEARGRFRRAARQRNCARSAPFRRRWTWRCASMRWKSGRTPSTSGTSSEI